MTENHNTQFDHELTGLKGVIIEMGGIAERIIEIAFASLIEGNHEKAHTAIDIDKQLDDALTYVEGATVRMIALRQPVAQDLRVIISAFRIAIDLERVGDLGKSTARHALSISLQSLDKHMIAGIENITELACNQIKGALDAYTKDDDAKAIQVRERDYEVDMIYQSLFGQVTEAMRADGQTVGMLTSLLFCLKNIERIGDHATNIAESTHYLATGKKLSDDRTRIDHILEKTAQQQPVL